MEYATGQDNTDKSKDSQGNYTVADLYEKIKDEWEFKGTIKRRISYWN